MSFRWWRTCIATALFVSVMLAFCTAWTSASRHPSEHFGTNMSTPTGTRRSIPGPMPQQPTAANTSRVAVLIIGSLRTFVWPAVCENIQENLVKGLGQPSGSSRWQVDVFFFFSLSDQARPVENHKVEYRHTYEAEMLSHCKRVLQPVHVELMPLTYKPPERMNCSKGDMPNYWIQTAYWNVTGATERKYSQCKRVWEAFNYVQTVYEPRVGVRYSAWVRARSDSVYLAKVPPIGSFDLQQLTVPAYTNVDHWHVVSRSCKSPLPFNCIVCSSRQYDECPKRRVVRTLDVHAVLARERPLSFFQSAAHPDRYFPHLKPRKGPNSDKGYLYLECFKWNEMMNDTAVNYKLQYTGDMDLCRKAQMNFLSAAPPYFAETPKATNTATKTSPSIPGPMPQQPTAANTSRVAVLIIGSLRTFVWPAVCENIQENLVKGLGQPSGSSRWQVDVFFFFSLSDQARPVENHKVEYRHTYEAEMLSHCKRVLQPVHVELMPLTYKPPERMNCSKGDMPNYWIQTAYWNVTGATERKYSQCKRVWEAFNYVQTVYEPRVGVRYSAWVRARSDSVYLAKVPPIGSFDLQQLTVPAYTNVDHWHVVSRSCKSPLPFNCIVCSSRQYEECPKRRVVRTLDVHAVLARERPLSFFQSAAHPDRYFPHLKPRKGPNSDKGYLYLECFKWNEMMNDTAVNYKLQYTGDMDLCRKAQMNFLSAAPPRSGQEQGCRLGF